MVIAAPHPTPCGERIALTLGPWTGFLHHASYSGSPDPTQSLDAGVIELREDVLRIAVFDAALPPTTTADVLRAYAAQLCRMAGSPMPLPVVWEEAAKVLCDPIRRPRPTNPCFAAAAVDIDLHSGTLDAVVSADCQVWARHGGTWSSLVGDDMLSAVGRSRYLAETAGMTTEAEKWVVHLDVLDDPMAWRRPPLGFCRPPRHARTKVAGADAVIVSSDGARLTPERCADLEGWLADGLHTVPVDHPYEHPHGDLWVTYLER